MSTVLLEAPAREARIEAGISVYDLGRQAFEKKMKFNENPQDFGEPDSKERRVYEQWANGWNNACHEKTLRDLKEHKRT